MSWAALLLIAAFTVVQVADWLQPDAHSFRLVTEYGEAVPYVEIEGAGEVRAARWENWRTREQWWMTQHPNDYNSRIFVESRYYDFWVKSAAKRMERNLLDSWGGSAEKRTVSDLDAVWHVDDRTYGYLLVRKDSQVFYLACSEKTADLTSYVEHCQEMLLNH